MIKEESYVELIIIQIVFSFRLMLYVQHTVCNNDSGIVKSINYANLWFTIKLEHKISEHYKNVRWYKKDILMKIKIYHLNRLINQICWHIWSELSIKIWYNFTHNWNKIFHQKDSISRQNLPLLIILKYMEHVYNYPC